MIIIKFNYFIDIRILQYDTENSFLYYILVCHRLPQVIDDIALIR